MLAGQRPGRLCENRRREVPFRSLRVRRSLLVSITLIASCLVSSVGNGEEELRRLGPQSELVEFESTEVSDESLAWWDADLSGAIVRDRPPVVMGLHEVMTTALQQAPEIEALHQDFLIRQAEIGRQAADFDWTAFVDTVWNRDSNPVSTLLDGTPNRLRTYSWGSSAGIWRRNHVGGRVGVSQDFGFLNSNSQFILPNNQGTGRMRLDYEQPLLRGRGRTYNDSDIHLAEVDKDIAYDQMQTGIQDYLLDVAVSYWNLVHARGRYAQQVRSWERAKGVAAQMEGRAEVDARPNQLNRVRTEVTNRWTQAISARYDLIRAQERLLRLVYGAAYDVNADVEVVTVTAPADPEGATSADQYVETGLQNRNEIHAAIRRIRFASIERGVAEHEILPVLNVILSTYGSGLRGDADIPQAFLDQFSTGEPGAGIGLAYEQPLGNRLAKETLRQRQLAVARLQNEMQSAISDVKLDIRQQVNEVNRFAQVIQLRREGLRQAIRDLDYLQARKEFLVDGSRVADLYLEDLLQSQNRLLAAEAAYLESQIGAAMAVATLQRSTGTLVVAPTNQDSGMERMSAVGR